MRYLLTIFVLLLGCSAFAQQYVPFPTNDGTTWRYYAEREYQNGNYYIAQEEQYLTAGDTTINGLQYKKVMLRRHIYDTVIWNNSNYTPPIINTNMVATLPDEYYGAYREDNKRIYCIIPSVYTTEKLRYDFNTLASTSTAIDSVLVGNTYHKRYKDSFSIYIIEGIGWLNSFLFFTNLGEEHIQFRCFTDAGDSYIPGTLCNYIFPYGTPASVNEQTAKEAVNIYPNPFADMINIQSGKAGRAIFYNSAGIKLMTTDILKGYNHINAPTLSSGIYLLVVQDDSGQVIKTEKIIK